MSVLIRDLPSDNRPRERLFKYGAQNLSTTPQPYYLIYARADFSNSGGPTSFAYTSSFSRLIASRP